MAKPQVLLPPERIGKTGIITGIVRIAYQSLITPRVSDLEDADKTPKYVAVLLFQPEDPALAMMKEIMLYTATEFFGEKKMPAELRNPIRDGSIKAAEYPFYAGHKFLTASSKNKPGLVDQALKPITDEEQVYSGMWARVELNCFAYDKKGNKGVSFGLNNLQKIADDEQFGGRRAAEKVFSQFVDPSNPFAGNGKDTNAGVNPFD